jgi:hypothetical protein
VVQQVGTGQPEMTLPQPVGRPPFEAPKTPWYAAYSCLIPAPKDCAQGLAPLVQRSVKWGPGADVWSGTGAFKLLAADLTYTISEHPCTSLLPWLLLLEERCWLLKCRVVCIPRGQGSSCQCDGSGVAHPHELLTWCAPPCYPALNMHVCSQDMLL